MPKSQRLTPREAEKRLLNAGFVFLRQKGSHKIYVRNNERIVIPHHSGKVLHPKIVAQVLAAIQNDGK